MLQSACPICQAKVSGRDLKAALKAALNHCGKVISEVTSEPIQRPEPLAPDVWVFERDLKSENDFVRAHWTTYQRDKSAWGREVEVPFGRYRHTDLPASSWRITRYYKRPRREYDFANLVGGSAKGLIDGLVRLKVIRDDSPRYFHCDYRQIEAERNYTTLEFISPTLP